MAHPTLGRPPRDLRAGFPDAAARLRAAGPRLGVRMLEIAVDRDPTLRDRHGELGLRKLLRDTEVIIDRVALTIASNDASFCREWAELVAPVYRRRRVPMDDIVHLFEALRLAAASVLSPTERMAADEGIDGAIAVLRWHRRIAGDARKRNPILQFLYKGA